MQYGILQASMLEWVAFPFPRGSSQPRDKTQVSLTAGGFFTSWVTREAQVKPIPSQDLPHPGIKPGSPTLQVDSLPAELVGKTKNAGVGCYSLLQGVLATQRSNLVLADGFFTTSATWEALT